ncbi:J domain-containing protein [Rhabdochromatium marinum]|uniref:J domain-containing protein n=1 Tax=Rhabdochromatium marinum TaxID=48729 RepID=UPI001906386D|nr:J domain-containing protein [Rhabdochromatium marinum]MBK1649072.1 hypothetical protein [Rhabdochromatium marinum]
MNNYYHLLDIEPSAGASDIRSAYKLKCKEYHPDKVAYLGADLQAVAARKMILINEAYRILGDKASRRQYDNSLKGNAVDRSIYVVCRSCGHSVQANPEEECIHHCAVCGEEIHLKFCQQPNLTADFNWHAILTFLQLSQHTGPGLAAPSSVQLRAQTLRFTLSYIPLDGFCLFTHGHQAYNLACQIAWHNEQHDWDQQEDIGYLSLPADINQTATMLERLECQLDLDAIKVYFNAGERKRGLAEPNVLFISAMLDISLITAQETWQKSGRNLYAVQWTIGDAWQERLQNCYWIVYGEPRRTRSHRDKQAASTLSNAQLRQSLDAIQAKFSSAEAIIERLRQAVD